MAEEPQSPAAEPRRSFVSQCLASLLAIVSLAVPSWAGLSVLLDPVRKRKQGDGGQWIRVASLGEVPADGHPHQFPVIDPQPRDKWNRYEPQPVGSVYLTRRTAEEPPMAFSSTCPHLGCTYEYRPGSEDFRCPCHNAIFHLDGRQAEGSTVSPRDLDPLEVKVDRPTGDVLVNYKRFKPGIAQREEV